MAAQKSTPVESLSLPADTERDQLKARIATLEAGLEVARSAAASLRSMLEVAQADNRQLLSERNQALANLYHHG